MRNNPVYLRVRSIEIYYLVEMIQAGRVYIRNPDDSWSRIEYQIGTGMGGYISRYIEKNQHHRYHLRFPR